MNTKTHCLQIAKKTGNKALMVKLALLNNIEGGNMVYLDNAYADISTEVTPREFAGHLSALTASGFYKSQDQHFGQIV